jgi:hypothetical protein
MPDNRIEPDNLDNIRIFNKRIGYIIFDASNHDAAECFIKELYKNEKYIWEV